VSRVSGGTILGHVFHDTKQGVRSTISEAARREVLQRLRKLNHEHYAEEVKRGLHGTKSKRPATNRPNKAASANPAEKRTLFLEDSPNNDSDAPG
jgi:hypothetical protein